MNRPLKLNDPEGRLNSYHAAISEPFTDVAAIIAS
jgi:hypothetical protein